MNNCISPDVITVKISNWYKFNPRSDVKNMTWFRFQTSFFDDPENYILSTNHKIFWIYLLCRAGLTSEKDKNVDDKTCVFSLQHATIACGLKKTEILQLLESLKELGRIFVDAEFRPDSIGCVRTRSDSYATDRQTDITDNTDKTNKTDIGAEKPDRKKHEVLDDSQKLVVLPHDIFCLYNKLLSDSLGKAKILTDERKKKILKLLKTQLTTIDDWETYFKKISESNFLTGASGKWRASFDWILNPANVVKILEGNYDNQESRREKEIKEAEKRLYEILDAGIGGYTLDELNGGVSKT